MQPIVKNNIKKTIRKATEERRRTTLYLHGENFRKFKAAMMLQATSASAKVDKWIKKYLGGKLA